MENFITKKEKKDALAKVAKTAAMLLERHKNDKYEYREISFLTGISPSRLSELVCSYKLNEKTLIGLLEGGFMKVDELLKKTKLSDKEKNYLNSFVMYEDRPLSELIAKMKRQGKDPYEILKQHDED